VAYVTPLRTIAHIVARLRPSGRRERVELLRRIRVGALEAGAGWYIENGPRRYGVDRLADMSDDALRAVDASLARLFA
jgi:hypothetical protein